MSTHSTEKHADMHVKSNPSSLDQEEKGIGSEVEPTGVKLKILPPSSKKNWGTRVILYKKRDRRKNRRSITTVRPIWWWLLVAAFLAIPLALIATKFRSTRIRDVHLLGLLFWLALSWSSLLPSYFTAWILGEVCHLLCQENLLNVDDYETFLRDLKWPVAILFSSIASWAMVPLLCVFDHRHCTDHWVSVFQRALLATLVVAIMWFVKSLLVELLYVKTAIEFMNKKQTRFENGVYAIKLLATRSEYVQKKQRECSKRDSKMMNDKAAKDGRDEKNKRGIKPGGTEATTVADAQRSKQLKDNPTANKDGKSTDIEDLSDSDVSTDDEESTDDDQPAPRKEFGNIQAYAQHEIIKHPNFKKFLGRLLFRSDTYISDKKAQVDVEKLTQKMFLGKGKRRIYIGLVREILVNFSTTNQLRKDEVEKHWIALQGSRITRRFSLEHIWKNLEITETDTVDRSELYSQIAVIGGGLREVKDGQSHLRKAVGDLDLILTGLFCIAAALVYVAFFVKDAGNYLLPLWTTFSGLSFALSGTVQEFVSSCVFVFAQHPYDVNDWVKVMDGDNKTMVKLKVKDIRLMNTTFHRKDESNIVLIPHNKISKERIENLSRWKYHTKGSVETIALSLATPSANEKTVEVEKAVERQLKLEEKIKNTVEFPETIKPKAELGEDVKKKVDSPETTKPNTELREEDKKSEYQKHFQDKVKLFVQEAINPPVRRYYRMPSVKLKPVDDEEQKMQLEIKFVSKRLISGGFEDEAKRCREAVVKHAKRKLPEGLLLDNTPAKTEAGKPDAGKPDAGNVDAGNVDAGKSTKSKSSIKKGEKFQAVVI